MYLEVLDESDFYLLVKLQKIPYGCWEDCLDCLKEFSVKYDKENKAFTIKKSKKRTLESRIEEIIELFKYHKESREETEKPAVYLNAIDYLDKHLDNYDDLNAKLEETNKLIKHLRTISIELNKILYKKG